MGPTWLYRPGIIQTVPRFMSAQRLPAAYLAPLVLTAALSAVFGPPGLFLRCHTSTDPRPPRHSTT